LLEIVFDDLLFFDLDNLVDLFFDLLIIPVSVSSEELAIDSLLILLITLSGIFRTVERLNSAGRLPFSIKDLVIASIFKTLFLSRLIQPDKVILPDTSFTILYVSTACKDFLTSTISLGLLIFSLFSHITFSVFFFFRIIFMFFSTFLMFSRFSIPSIICFIYLYFYFHIFT